MKLESETDDLNVFQSIAITKVCGRVNFSRSSGGVFSNDETEGGGGG